MFDRKKKIEADAQGLAKAAMVQAAREMQYNDILKPPNERGYRALNPETYDDTYNAGFLFSHLGEIMGEARRSELGPVSDNCQRSINALLEQPEQTGDAYFVQMLCSCPNLTNLYTEALNACMLYEALPEIVSLEGIVEMARRARYQITELQFGVIQHLLSLMTELDNTPSTRIMIAAMYAMVQRIDAHTIQDWAEYVFEKAELIYDDEGKPTKASFESHGFVIPMTDEEADAHIKACSGY